MECDHAPSPLAKGYPNWSIRLIDLEADGAWPLPELFALPPDPQGNARVYRAHEWYQQQFRAACVSVGEELAPVRASTAPLSYACPQGQSLERCGYRSGGIYVVIGGAGGIGEIWSEYMIRRYQAQVIWIGRRKIDAGILAKQERLAALGPRPYYITADASELLALQRAYDDILRNFGRIHGVVHSAIVLLDQSLASMDEERFRAALAAKVDVSVRLAQVFEQEPLDFVLFFSSIHAFLRPAGQSNYAAGCTFEDAFAARLGRDWPCAVKVMNWGYWGSVGVVASPEYRERMARAGFGSIEPTEAMEALEVLLSSPMDQCVFLKTTRAQALGDINTSVAVGRDSARHLSGAWPPTTLPAKKSEKGKQGADITDQMVKDHVQSILLESIAEVLKVDERIIEVDTNFSAYGVDSIVAVNLINVINEKCGLTLQTTVLFDHNNVKQLLQYIVQKHEETLRTMLQENTTCLSGDKLPSSTVSPTATTYQRVARTECI
ncbi:MAG: SDR family NAD(P)-dependent oxidoreductase [Chloroflexi bacterium]|nr:MAG: SDR family NAD(P)-dependent oxidoreductase [Chloroflexota bacterium]